MPEKDQLIRVLIVDDDPAQLLLMRTILTHASEYSFEVATASCLADGIEKLKEGGFDVVLLDLSLPDSQGLETFHRVHMACNDTPVVVISGMDDEETPFEAVRNGAQDYLVKGPALRPSLVRCVRYAVERKRAEDKKRQIERQIQQSESLFRTMFDSLAIGIFVTDADGFVTYTNQAYRSILPCRADQLLGESFCDLVHRRERERALAAWKEALSGQCAFEHEVKILPEGGEQRWVRVRGTPLVGISGYIGVLEDITAEKIFEQKELDDKVALESRLVQQLALSEISQLALTLRDVELFLSEAAMFVRSALSVEYVRIMVPLVDGSALLFKVGAGWRDGYAGHATVGLELEAIDVLAFKGRGAVAVTDFLLDSNVVQPQFVADREVRSGLAVAIPGKEASFGVICVESVKPRKFPEHEVFFLQSAANLLAAAVQRIRAEEQLARSNSELQQFAYVAAHDLREPLRAVVSYMDLLDRHLQQKIDPASREYISSAVAGGKRMESMISALLEFARVGQSDAAVEPVDTAQVVCDVLDDLKVLVNETGAVVTFDKLPVVSGDSRLIARLFQNLIHNAVKFRGELPPAVHISAKQSGPMWMFAVRDNGIGIDMQFAERIFRVFQRLHSRTEYGGIGIGLSICKKIVELYGGTIWVESAPQEGSTFFFTLPG